MLRGMLAPLPPDDGRRAPESISPDSVMTNLGSNPGSTQRIYLVRHGETEWSQSGRHTSFTDIPLTAEGERRAVALAPVFTNHDFALVLSSPMQRATRTCELAGLGGRMERTGDLMEWNYGDYEGRTTAEIRSEATGWTIFHDGAPRGETAEEVAVRARRVIDRAIAARGDAILFAHGHLLRVLAATWLRLAPEDGEHFALETGTVSMLGFERETRVIRVWNGRV